jgi:hypothetical protein
VDASSYVAELAREVSRRGGDCLPAAPQPRVAPPYPWICEACWLGRASQSVGAPRGITGAGMCMFVLSNLFSLSSPRRAGGGAQVGAVSGQGGEGQGAGQGPPCLRAEHGERRDAGADRFCPPRVLHLPGGSRISKSRLRATPCRLLAGACSSYSHDLNQHVTHDGCGWWRLRWRQTRPTPPPPPRTKWTRRVPHPVLIGHAASLTPY